MDRPLFSEPIGSRREYHLFVDPVILEAVELGGMSRGKWQAPIIVADQPSRYQQPFAPEPFIPIDKVKPLRRIRSGR